MKGWVYIISNQAMPGLIKVGYSMKDPEIRASNLNNTGNPHPYEVVYNILVDDPYEVEKKVHKNLESFNEAKEWFHCEPSVAIEAIHLVIGKPIPQKEEEDSIFKSYTSIWKGSCIYCDNKFTVTVSGMNNGVACPKCKRLNKFIELVNNEDLIFKEFGYSFEYVYSSCINIFKSREYPIKKENIDLGIIESEWLDQSNFSEEILNEFQRVKLKFTIVGISQTQSRVFYDLLIEEEEGFASWKESNINEIDKDKIISSFADDIFNSLNMRKQN